MSFNEREKWIVLAVVGAVAVGGGVLLGKRANARFAGDLRVPWSETQVKPGRFAGEDVDGNEVADAALVNHMRTVKRAMELGGSGGDRAAVTAQRKVDLNSAKEGDLILLDGIGPVRARAIVRYRDEVGPFRVVEDVMKVEGIGPGTFARIAKWVCVDGERREDRAK